MPGLLFLNPLLLAGLALGGLPILIHLLSRRRFTRVDWAALRFLKEAEKQNRRRLRFEQWLLVALRCLILMLLALMIARPVVRSGLVASLLGSSGALRVIVLDDSASLGFRWRAASADFDVLRDSALRLLGWLEQEAPGDSLVVYLTSQGGKPLMTLDRIGSGSAAELKQRIARLAPADLPAHPRAVFERLAIDLGEAAARQRADVYVLSDFQRSDWLAAGSAAQTAFEPLRKLDVERVRVVMLAATDQSRDNVAVVGLALDRAQTIAGVLAVARAEIANHGRQPLSGARLSIEFGGAPLAPVPIEPLGPGESRVVPLEFTPTEAGSAELRVSLAAGDGLAIDDQRRVGLRVKDALSILLLNGQPSTEPMRDEVHLLRSALAPPGPFGSGMRVEVIDPDALDVARLAGFDVIALCNLPPPGDVTAAQLARYVQDGGGLLIFLGDAAGDGVDFNRAMWGDGAGVLPLPIDGAPRTAPSPTGVGIARTIEHLATAAFPGEGADLSESIRFRTYYRLSESSAEPAVASAPASAPAAPSALVLARFLDGAGSPALVEKQLGRGRVLLFASSADLDWNDWPRALDGSYVVAMLDWVQFVARRDADESTRLTGEPAELTVALDGFEPAARLRSVARPDDPPLELRALGGPVDQELVTLVGPPLMRAGEYRAELIRRDGGAESRVICANLDARESELAVASRGELDAAVQPLPHEYLLASEAYGDAGEHARRELWPLLLALVAGLLMLEHALAWRFGLPVRRAAIGPGRFAIGGGSPAR